MLSLILLAILFTFTLFYDMKYRKIPNWLTGTFILIGFISAIWLGGFSALMYSLLGMTIGFLLLLVPYMLGGVGGGDVKFLAAIGSLTTVTLLFQIFLVGLVVGGTFSLFIILKNEKIKGLKQIIYFFLFKKYFKNTNIKNATIPLGACISLAGFFLIGFKILG
jgi:prepilin peptidase CpaA